ncbi:hypothetical protein SRHO_G00148810 [Serrasalmus rhombeus]
MTLESNWPCSPRESREAGVCLNLHQLRLFSCPPGPTSCPWSRKACNQWKQSWLRLFSTVKRLDDMARVLP